MRSVRSTANSLVLKKILKSNPLNFCSQLVKILEYVLQNDYFPPPILLEQSSTRWKQEVWLKEEFDDFSFLSALYAPSWHNTTHTWQFFVFFSLCSLEGSSAFPQISGTDVTNRIDKPSSSFADSARMFRNLRWFDRNPWTLSRKLAY